MKKWPIWGDAQRKEKGVQTMRGRFLGCLMLLPLAGCGYLGQDEYGCAGMPDGVQCLSAAKVYEATHTRDALGPTEASKQAPASQAPIAPALPPQWAPAPDLSEGKVALRTPAQVMRVYVAPWEDDKGSLHLPGMVFAEIEPRRWQVGLRQEDESRLLKPLFTMEGPAAPAAAPPPEQTKTTKKEEKKQPTRKR